MKKLMTIAAAALCAAAVQGQDGITSTAVVGYAQKNLRKNAMIVTPQFLGVANADGKVELQSITCRNEDSDNVVLSTLDSVGAKVKTYYWVNYGGENEDELCWLDFDTDAKPESPVCFEPGQALWVEGKSADNVFVTAGQVGTKDITVQLQYGSTLTGNPTPVKLDLQDIICRDADSDNVVLSILDSVGAKVKTYYWVNYGGENENELCWLDFDTDAKPDPAVSIEPGDGFYVEGRSSENEITFPGVEL